MYRLAVNQVLDRKGRNHEFRQKNGDNLGRCEGKCEDKALSIMGKCHVFVYIYGDIVSSYVPVHIENVIAGKVAGFQIIPRWLLGVMLLMTIPSLMVLLSLTLKAKPNHWANIIVGTLQIVGLVLFVVLPAGDVWAYYIFASLVEAVLLSLIVWYAWNWPKQEA